MNIIIEPRTEGIVWSLIRQGYLTREEFEEIVDEIIKGSQGEVRGTKAEDMEKRFASLDIDKALS